MKRFDLTQPGGFPLTQERIKWLMDGYIEALTAVVKRGATLPAAAPNAIAVRLHGCELTSGTGSAGTVSDGWVVHATHGVLPFFGGTWDQATNGLAIVDITTNLTYQNASSLPSQITKAVVINNVPQAVIPPSGGQLTQLLNTNYADQFLLSRTLPVWNNLVNTADDEIYYCFDPVTSVVTVRGKSKHRNIIGVPVQGLVATLPVDARPTETLYFRTNIPTHSLPIVRDSNGDLMTGDVGRINSSGNLSISTRSIPTPTYNDNFFHHFIITYPTY